MKSSLNSDVSSAHLKWFTDNFFDINYMYKFFTSQQLRYDESLFLSKSSMYLLLASTYKLIARHKPVLIPFSTIKNILISVKIEFYFTFFLKLLAMLILVQYKNERDWVHIFLDTYFKCSLIHRLTILHELAHASHDIFLNRSFESLNKRFFWVCNLPR